LAANGSSAAVPTNVGTTNIMSAEMLGPPPRVGKAHLAVDEVSEDSMDIGSAGNVQSEESTPKEARRSDGSRRGGGFGSMK
jgi:hypothetical protein